MNPSDLPHLARRFFGSLRARRPGAETQLWVARVLERDALIRLFFAQAIPDQSHAIDVARRVEQAAPGRIDLARAALLHDVGKEASRLGVTGRTIASLLSMGRLPTTPRLRQYLEHDRIGGERLQLLGADPVTVAFASHHRSAGAPFGLAPHDWALLRSADAD